MALTELVNYDEKAAAKILGVSVKTLQMWRFLGKGPTYLKIGRSVRYPSPDLQTFMDDCRVQPAA